MNAWSVPPKDSKRWRKVRYAFTNWQFWSILVAVFLTGFLTGCGLTLLDVQYQWFL